MMRFRAFLAAGLLAIAPLAAADRVFTPDTNHTVIGFKASTILFEVPGRFDRYKVSVQGDPDTLSPASVRLEIEAKSINTANKDRDNHLRTKDFFDVATYPKIVFTSSKVWRDSYKVIVQGVLEMHGKKKDMQITFLESKGKNGAGTPTWSYRAQLPINRQEFGIGVDSIAAKISLKDEVQLDLLLVGFFNEAPEQKAPAKKKS